MAYNLIPHKACILGFGLQTAKDVLQASDYRLPINESEDLNWQKNYSFFQYSDGNYTGPTQYFSEGEWIEGTITMPIVPTMLNGPIGQWIWERTGTYNQGRWATLYRDMGHVREYYLNCKVISGSITFDYGALATLKLNVVGINPPVATGVFAGTRYEQQPYVYQEAAISLGLGEGALGANVMTRNHGLEFDNMVMTPADAGTLNGSTAPEELPNSAYAQWTGTFDKFLEASQLYEDFLNGIAGQYQVIMERVDVARLTIAFPRIVYTEAPLNIPNADVLKQDGISFQALGSTDGLTQAFALEETIL